MELQLLHTFSTFRLVIFLDQKSVNAMVLYHKNVYFNSTNAIHWGRVVGGIIPQIKSN